MLVGYFFGGVPFVQEHFEIIVLGIVAVSVAPAFIAAVKGAIASRKKSEQTGIPVDEAEIEQEIDLRSHGEHADVIAEDTSNPADKVKNAKEVE